MLCQHVYYVFTLILFYFTGGGNVSETKEDGEFRFFSIWYQFERPCSHLLQELLETYASETLIQQGEEAKTLLGYS